MEGGENERENLKSAGYMHIHTNVTTTREGEEERRGSMYLQQVMCDKLYIIHSA